MNRSKKQQNFSISNKYEQVRSILKTTPNMSEFICLAIIEKYQRDKDEEDNKIKSLDRETLREEIMSVLQEVSFKDVFIVKGNPSQLTISQSEEISTELVSDIDEVPKAEVVDDETAQQLKDIIDSW